MSESDRRAAGSQPEDAPSDNAHPEVGHPEDAHPDAAHPDAASAGDAHPDESADEAHPGDAHPDESAGEAHPGDAHPDKPVDEEPPIEVLKDFAFPRDQAFAGELRGRIERRVVAGEMVRLSTRAWCAVLLEFLSLLKPPKRDQERSDGNDVRADP